MPGNPVHPQTIHLRHPLHLHHPGHAQSQQSLPQAHYTDTLAPRSSVQRLPVDRLMVPVDPGVQVPLSHSIRGHHHHCVWTSCHDCKCDLGQYPHLSISDWPLVPVPCLLEEDLQFQEARFLRHALPPDAYQDMSFLLVLLVDVHGGQGGIPTVYLSQPSSLHTISSNQASLQNG